MALLKLPIFAFGIASLVARASAGFGFTNPSFDYVTASSPINLAWNGQTGLVTLRLLVYPPDQAQSYLPIAANLSGTSYTWMPPSLAAGSKWTLEGLDDGGQIASSPSAFTAQGDGSVNSGSTPASTTAFLQQNPQTTFITSSTSPTSQATTSSTSSPTSTDSAIPSPTGTASASSHNTVAIALGVIFGVALVISLIAFFLIRRRWGQGKTVWPYRSPKPSPKESPMISELESKERLSRHYMELEGSDMPGSVETSMGKRVELG